MTRLRRAVWAWIIAGPDRRRMRKAVRKALAPQLPAWLKGHDFLSDFWHDLH